MRTITNNPKKNPLLDPCRVETCCEAGGEHARKRGRKQGGDDDNNYLSSTY